MRTLLFTLLLFVLPMVTFSQNAEALVAEMIETLGGKKKFYALKNVTYDYDYNSPSGTQLSNHETYVFHNELSYAKYSKHSMLGPNGEKVIEGYDGQNAWVTINGKLSNDAQAKGIARFMRKTNYYWFAMFFKLLDNGVNQTYKGSKTIDGKTYDIVEITFGDNVGDAQDIYVLYINKKTKLVDQFLFTVMGMGRKDPLLLQMDYETIDGIQVPSKRKYVEADWDANVKGKEWTTVNWTHIKFNTEIDKALFEVPVE